MSENTYVRELKIFNPSRDLASVDEKGAHCSSRAANPMAGLLQSESLKADAAPASPARERGGSPSNSPAPAVAAPGKPDDALPIMGDAPDIIEGDFADPIDI